MMLGYTAWAQFVSAEQDLQVDTSTFELLVRTGLHLGVRTLWTSTKGDRADLQHSCLAPP